MPALDITGLGRAGMDLAWQLAANNLTACTLRDDPQETDYDPVTGTYPAGTVWGTSQDLSAFIYLPTTEGGEVEKNSVEAADKLALIRFTDVTGKPSTKAELVETVSGIVWHVFNVEDQPGDVLYILHLRA